MKRKWNGSLYFHFLVISVISAMAGLVWLEIQDFLLHWSQLYFPVLVCNKHRFTLMFRLHFSSKATNDVTFFLSFILSPSLQRLILSTLSVITPFHSLDKLLHEEQQRYEALEFQREADKGVQKPRDGDNQKKVWVVVCRRGLQTLTLFKTKIVHFVTLFKTSRLNFMTLTHFFSHRIR